MPSYDLLIAYESDCLDDNEIVELFQQVYDTQAWKWLQGHYGRTLEVLINDGFINTSN